MLSLETVPRLEAASRQFFQVLVLASVLADKALVLVLVLAHTVLLTSRGFDNLTLPYAVRSSDDAHVGHPV
jgi:hypothetical protein